MQAHSQKDSESFASYCKLLLVYYTHTLKENLTPNDPSNKLLIFNELLGAPQRCKSTLDERHCLLVSAYFAV
jgi:hypothetical protein